MPHQLDILALEPFHGGGRRAMLDAISRCSRHRWTILKLPARRLERRLLVAATWFAELLSRNEVGNVDLLFCSEVLNLADLFRLRPDLSRRPSVVYFHDNQLPEPSHNRLDMPTDLVNLNSAMAATEIWFNSQYNQKTFLGRAAGLVARHRELQGHNPLASLTAKARLVRPPIDMTEMHEIQSQAPAAGRDPRSLLVDARGADPRALAEALMALERRRENIHFTIIGRLAGLPESMRPTFLNEQDDRAHVRALVGTSVLLTARISANASDDLAVRAIALGCHPVLPDGGVYAELLPTCLHMRCLHDGTAESMVARVLDGWYSDRPDDAADHVGDVLTQYDAIRACKVIDDQLERLAAAQAARVAGIPPRPVAMAAAVGRN